jgi:cobalt-zinc-cadmium efflux system outer membrane protein
MYWERLAGALAAVTLVTTVTAAQSPPSTTIADLIRMALETNQRYLASRERLNEAQAAARSAGLRPAPMFEAETGIGAILGSQGEAEYSAAYIQTIETGGKREKRLAIAAKGIALAQAELQETERQLAFDVKLRAIAVISQGSRLVLTRGLLATSEDSYRLTTQRVGLGDAAPLEEQLLSAEVHRTQAQIAAMESEREAFLAELYSAVGGPPSQGFGLRETELQLQKPPSELARLQSYALQHRPDLRVLELLEEQAAAEVALAGAETRPDLTASARYTRSSSRFDQFGVSEAGERVPLRDTDNILTFGLSIPLFTKSRAQPVVDAAGSRQAQQRLRRDHLRRAIPQEVEAAYRRWTGAWRSLEILRTGVLEPSQKSLAIVREAYRLGQLRLLDVLGEQRRIADLQLAVVDAQADVARALAELERAIGGNLP